MPRDGLQQYSPPPGTEGIPNYTVESARYNAFVADVTQDLNLPRPIVAGGTGASTPDGALDNISAEKFKQVVTNWDSMVWRAGSFYAATTATGIAPVTGHAFAGIAYYANATDYVTEAVDVTDPANPDKYIRAMSAGVWGPWVRINATTSSANLAEYVFDNQVTFPPGSGQIRFNNATQNAATEVFISHLSPMGVDNTAVLTFYLKSGVDLVIQDKDEGSKYKIFTTTADAVLSGSDFRVTVTFKSGGTDIVSGQRILAAVSGEAQRVQQRQLIYAAPFDALAYNGMQINGSMEVDQAAAGNVGSATYTTPYFMDGWVVQAGGAVQVLASPLTASPAPPPGFQQYARIYTNVGVSGALAAGDLGMLFTKIEGYRVSRLGWGTASAQPITIGFWVYPPIAGNMAVSVENSANDRCYVIDVPVVATTWQYKTVTIPGCTDGTWLATNGTGMKVHFCFGAGSTFQGQNGTWSPAQKLATSATTNFLFAAGAQSCITGVVILPGIEAPSATRSSLIMRPYDQELVTCQRYYTRTEATARYFAVAAGYNLENEIYWQVKMRSAPTLTTIAGAQSNISAVTANQPTISGARFGISSAAGGDFYAIQQIIIADARL